MARTHSVFIVGAGSEEAEAISRQLDDVAKVVGTEPDPDQARSAIREHAASVALLYLDQNPTAVLQLSRELGRANGCASIVVSRDRDPDTILLAMRSGVRDFAYLDGEDNDVRRAILGLEVIGEEEEGGRGKVIAVFASKGGSGATTLATNLGGALVSGEEKGGGRAVLVDLDFQMGDVMVFLDLASRYSFKELLRNLHRLDDALLHRSLSAHSSGLRVVAQADDLEEADEIDGEGVARAIGFLRQHYDYVVLDGLRDFGENALAALDLADHVLLTMTQDIPALKNANRCLGVFRRLGYGGDKVKLILNRFHKREKLDLDSVADALGTQVHSTVANDFPTVLRSINEGQILVESAPRARVTKDIRELASVLGEGQARARRGLFGRLR